MQQGLQEAIQLSSCHTLQQGLQEAIQVSVSIFVPKQPVLVVPVHKIQHPYQ